MSFVSDTADGIKSLYKDLLTSQFVKNVSGTLLTRFLILVLGMLTSILVARGLGPEGRGLYAIATTITLLGIQFSNLGLHSANIFHIAQDKTLLKKMVSNSVFIGVVFGIAVAVIVYISSYFYSNLVHGVPLIIASLTIPLGLSYLLLQNLLVGLGLLKEYNTIELIVKIVLVCIIVLLYMFHLIRLNFILLGLLVIPALGILLIFRNSIFVIEKPDLSLLKKQLPYGIKIYLSCLFSFLTLKLSVFFVQHFSGEVETGLFSVALSILDMISVFGVVVGTILFSKLSSIADNRQKIQLTFKTLKVMSIVNLLTILAVLLLGKSAVHIAFGIDFIRSYYLLVWLLPGFFFMNLNLTLMNTFASFDAPHIIVLYPLLIAIINTILMLSLIPIQGTEGACLSVSISSAVMFLLCAIYLNALRKRNAC